VAVSSQSDQVSVYETTFTLESWSFPVPDEAGPPPEAETTGQLQFVGICDGVGPCALASGLTTVWELDRLVQQALTPQGAMSYNVTFAQPVSLDPDTVGEQVDLSGLDVCTLLDDDTITQLAGEPLPFLGPPGPDSCFWAGRNPAYVEVFVGPQNGLNADFFGGCSGTPIEGVGEAAAGGTCVTNSQSKVFLNAFERGVQVSVILNEPGGRSRQRTSFPLSSPSSASSGPCPAKSTSAAW